MMQNRMASLFYTIFGSMSQFGHKAHIEFLRQRIPDEFKGRGLVDLGCGDGRNTLRLVEIFEPSSIVGYDLHPALVIRSRRRGIEAHVADIEKEKIKGELGVLWGVLHHVKRPKELLIKLRRDFDYLFIREKVSKVLFELGHPFSKEALLNLCEETLGLTEILEYKNRTHIIFIFYKKR